MNSTISRIGWMLIPISIISAFFFIYYANETGNDWGLSWTPNLGTKLASLFGGLIISAALIDQFIVVFFPDKDSIDQKLSVIKSKRRNSKEAISEINNHLFSVGLEMIGNKDDLDLVEYEQKLIVDKTSHEKQIIEYNIKLHEIMQEKSIRIRRISFVVGLVLTFCGVRFLTELVQINETNRDLHDWILRYCDMIFTAAIISGGTSGVNQFFAMIKGYLNQDNA